MMKIYVEGQTDQKLIQALCKQLNIDEDYFKIVLLNGSTKSNLLNRINEFKAADLKNWKNKVFLDADNSLEDKKKLFNEFISENNLKAELYLFPNNYSAGIIEDLLFQIIPNNRLSILDCFDKYESCLAGLNYRGNLKKSKLYAYTEAASLNLSIKEREKNAKLDFTSIELWDFNSDALDNLKEFLLK
jgi:hypothetical protein